MKVTKTVWVTTADSYTYLRAFSRIADAKEILESEGWKMRGDLPTEEENVAEFYQPNHHSVTLGLLRVTLEGE